MKNIFITIAVEDILSELIVKKILYYIDKNIIVTKCLRKGGDGYLKSKINNFNQAAKTTPFLVLADQDRGCPPKKISAWLKTKANPNFIFRIAVMEVESWILAHRDAFAKFISVSKDKIPKETDTIGDPKKFLLSLVSRSKSKRLRSDIVPSKGSTATVGPDYNGRLSIFIQTQWNPLEAKSNSESLNRMINRIQEFREAYK